MTVAPGQITVDSGVSGVRPSAGTVRRFIALGILSIAAMLAAALLLRLPALATALAAASLTAALVVFTVLLSRGHPHSRLGAANVVTLLRLTIVGVLLGILLAGGGNAAIVIPLSIVALSLDGVDGFLARRQKLASPFGAAFDMEVDSAFALVLSVSAALGPAGPAALLLGMPRYLFGIAGRAAPWLNGPLAPRFSRKVICVVQLIVLITLQLPSLATWSALTLVVLTVGLLAWSFGVDIVSLARSRSRSRSRGRSDA